MFLLIPIGHDELLLRRLPFATIGLMLVCAIAFALTVSRVDDEESRVERRAEALSALYAENDYLELPASVVEAMEPGARALYRAKRSWLAAYETAPEEAIDPAIAEGLASPNGPMLATQAGVAERTVAAAGRAGAAVDARIEALARSAFLVRYLSLPEERIAEAEAALAERAAALEAALGDSTLRRLGYVPADPGFGLISSIFVHAGFLHLLGNLLFLWIAAVKLEELWSRPAFVACFLLFGIAGNLIHGATTADPTAPCVGASGAIAGLMGAMLVRLPRDRIHFVYFFWFFMAPRFGRFAAPAALMIPLWLVAQIAAARFGGADGVAYAAHIGGFAVGCAVALALRLARFEERVLGRAPAEKEAPPPVELPNAALPLPGSTAAPAARIASNGAVLVGIEKGSLRFALPSGEPLAIAPGEIRAWAMGRIGAATPLEEELLGGAPIRTPAVFLAFAARPRAGRSEAREILVDAARLRYSALLDRRAPTPREAFFRLVARLAAALPDAAFAGDRARVEGGALREYATLRELRDHLAAIAGFPRAHSQESSSES